MQEAMTGENIAAEAARLLDNPQERDNMKADLARVAAMLAFEEHARCSVAGDRRAPEGSVLVRAADEVERVWEGAK